jgi:glycosyltransferase involved in cell wall biosynthesis
VVKCINARGRYRKMKIGIDIQSTCGKKTGIGYYARNLTDGLKRNCTHDLSCYCNNRHNDLSTLQRMRWENIALPSMAKKGGVDLLHIPGFAGPRKRHKFKKITTVCDLIGMIYPENMGRVSRFYWQKWLPQCVKSSDLIIAISDHTKRDIIRLLDIPEERIRVTLLAADRRFVPVNDGMKLEELRLKYNLPKRFMLTVSTIEPRKNICGLIKAFDGYIKDSKLSDLCLVITGNKGWGYAKAYGLVKNLGIEDRVFFTDYIEDNDLPYLYNLAEFFVYPSFYEGFGLPVLEALSCGKAVISSNTSSLPEVTGEAALLISPENTEQLKDAIKVLDTDKGLREELAAGALVQARKFSWEKTVEQTIKVYEEVLG